MELWQWHCRIPFHFSQFQKFFFTPLFRQYHCHNCQKFIPSISAMLLPQTIFFPSHFQQWHCHNCQNFFFPIIWFSLRALTLRAPTRAEGIATISLPKQKISLSYFLSFSLQLLLNFGNGIATIHSLFSDY